MKDRESKKGSAAASGSKAESSQSQRQRQVPDELWTRWPRDRLARLLAGEKLNGPVGRNRLLHGNLELLALSRGRCGHCRCWTEERGR